jgi:hypothetical protein
MITAVARKDKPILYPCNQCGSSVTTRPDWMPHVQEPDFALVVICPKCGERPMSQREFQ